MYKLTIDGIPCEVREGTTILQAARKLDVRIPTLCFLRKTNAIASCRICVVELEGSRTLVPACSTYVSEGMVVTTNSPRIHMYRKRLVELIASSLRPTAVEALSSETEFARLCRRFGVECPSGHSDVGSLNAHPFLAFNPGICIACQRCVGACNQRAYNHTLQTAHQGLKTIIDAPFGDGWDMRECESCGQCAQACPTGAITEKHLPVPVADIKSVRTTCPHCGVGCQLDLLVRDGRVIGAKGAKGPANDGMLCVKGRSASFDFLSAGDRLRTPLVRNEETFQLEPASWDEALSLVAQRFMQLRNTYGGESLAAFACSRSTNEDIYQFQKMARVAFRTNNVDNCARV